MEKIKNGAETEKHALIGLLFNFSINFFFSELFFAWLEIFYEQNFLWNFFYKFMKNISFGKIKNVPDREKNALTRLLFNFLKNSFFENFFFQDQKFFFDEKFLSNFFYNFLKNWSFEKIKNSAEREKRALTELLFNFLKNSFFENFFFQDQKFFLTKNFCQIFFITFWKIDLWRK